MSCNCTALTKPANWTPVPEYRQPTSIQPGENIDCYMKRSGSQSGLMNDVGEKEANRIDNTSLTSDLNRKVDVQFVLTPNSTSTASSWDIDIKDGDSHVTTSELGLTFIDGNLSGTVPEAKANKNYKVLITAKAGADVIDSREFNFYPKTASKDTTVKFVIPLDGNVHVTCGYGPRKPPAVGASSDHKGMDFARVDHSAGNILAAGDGTVVRCGTGKGWGNVIFIEHKDASGKIVATTVYGHWAESYVKEGQIVAMGQKIALEGNVGIGSGKHLHFEMHKGKFGNPTDPAPYLNGTTPLPIASNNSNDTVGADGTATPTGFTDKPATQSAGMTSGEAENANADCPGSTSDKPLPADKNIQPGTEQDPDIPPAAGDVATIIKSECAAAGLTDEETRFILTVATIESGLKADAKNPTSSATGLYQMLDAIATKYYGVLGLSPTHENRIDPAKATKAMIQFFKNEFRPYYNGYLSSGKTKIANKNIHASDWSAQYPNFSMGEFMYGLIHHDGVGTAVSGVDKGGVAYWRKKVKTA
jgi:murein DD-endopeptidase MepM/ murein hydrolase activator NlpD